MGRKKRRVSANGEPEPETSQTAPADPRVKAPPPPPPPPVVKVEADDTKDGEKEGVKASSYAVTSHSGEIVEEDIYVSDGSEDEDDNVDVVLSGSKMGLMRRGLHQPLLVQPNLRQWVRPEATTEGEAVDATEEKQRQKEEEELAALDPAERAARLLVEKQKKLEEAKENARRMESEENAGRDPCLFSKRTAFDIRFDQIDDKPWERGNGDLTDFFNYGLTVEDWLEYAQQQLTIRQELTDASRQKRPPDPNVVPVAARKPKSQTPKVAVADAKGEGNEDGDNVNSDEEAENAPVIGPAMVKKEESDDDGKGSQKDAADETTYEDVYVGDGGAWGAGAAPDSMLARLIAEQTQKANGGVKIEPRPPVPNHHQSNHHNQNDHYSDNKPYRDDMPMQHNSAGDSYDNRGNPGGYDDPSMSSYGGGGGDWRQQRPPPPPPPSFQGGPPPFQGQYGGGGGRFEGGGGGRFDGGGGRFDGGGRYGGRGRGRGRGRGGRGRGGPRPPFPPQGQRWGGRGGRGDFRRPRDDYGGGGGGYYQGN